MSEAARKPLFRRSLEIAEGMADARSVQLRTTRHDGLRPLPERLIML